MIPTTHGSALSASLFPPQRWRGPLPVAALDDAGAVSYPGRRPEGSFLVRDEQVHGMDPLDGWRWAVRGDGDIVDVSERHLLLAYGSNVDPAKLARRLHGEVAVLRCAVLDHAAVWCAGRRREDGSVVATLTRVEGHVEVHALLAVDGAQRAAIDRWEGHPHRYRRQPFEGRVLLESAAVSPPATVEVYLGIAPERQPLRPLHLVATTSHDQVDGLVPGGRMPSAYPVGRRGVPGPEDPEGHPAALTRPTEGHRMAVDPKLLEILICPDCREDVVVEPAEDGSEEIVCQGCGLRYPVREDIPVMLVDQAARP